MRKTLLTLLLQFIVVWAGVAQGIGGNANPHTKVISGNGDKCNPIITVEDAGSFAVGDRIFLLQMKGAEASTTTSTFGEVHWNKIGATGFYEFNNIGEIDYVTNTITLVRSFSHNYDLFTKGYGAMQMVKVFTGTNVSTTSAVTCDAWNGGSGGVIVIEVANTFTINHNIEASGKGFRGGIQPNIAYGSGQAPACDPYLKPFLLLDKNYYETANKGEGICADDNWPFGNLSIMAGSGAWGNAGGGGMTHNNGGGGGSNYGAGGRGGKGIDFCGYDNPGAGGRALNFNNRLFFGGGGGAGHQNNRLGGAGAPGGGIIIIKAATIQFGPGVSINANGADAVNTTNDAAGGGGGGGTIVICANNATGSVANVTFKGGKGGDHTHNPTANFDMGPGGGGGGGLFYRSSALATKTLLNPLGGLNGKSTKGNTNWGAAQGNSGQLIGNCIPWHEGPELCELEPIEITPCQGELTEICFNVCSDVQSVFITVGGYAGEYFPDNNGQVCITLEFESDIQFPIFFKYNDQLSCPGLVVIVDVVEAEVHTTTIYRTCGESVNLDDYIQCDDDFIDIGWSTGGMYPTMVLPVVTPDVGQNVYRRTTYTDANFDCKECISEVIVIVTPLPVQETTLYKCENEPVTLTPHSLCQPSGNYEWFLNGQPHISGLSSIYVSAHDGDQYLVTTTLPNGCTCSTLYIIETNGPVYLEETVHVMCGESIDLSLYDRCGGYALGWEEGTEFPVSIEGPVVWPTGNTTYRRYAYSDPDMTCLSCVMTINVIIDPLPPYVVTLIACEEEEITIGPASGCLPAENVVITLPDGTQQFTTAESINVYAHQGDVYQFVTTMPNGCVCSTTVIIQTTTEYQALPIQLVDCGTTIDLNDYAQGACAGEFGYWEDITNQMALAGSIVTITGPRQFRKRVYSDDQLTCLICELLLNFDIKPNITTKVVFGCEGEDIDISTDASCNSGVYYDWFPPNGLPFGSPYSTITFTAHDNDQYMIIGYDANGCACTTIVIVRTTPVIQQGGSFEVVCGSTVNLNDYFTGCPGDVFRWYDEDGNEVIDPENVVITSERTFRKETDGELGCVWCKGEIKFIPADPEPIETVLEIGCSGDQQILSTTGCNGGAVEYFDEYGDPIPSPVLVGRTNEGDVIIAKGIYPNGCPCEERITITVTEIVTTHYDGGVVDVDCRQSINLDPYSHCPGTTGEWENDHGGQSLNGQHIGSAIEGDVTYYRETISSNCERCLETVTIRTSNDPVINTYDPNVYYLCEGEYYYPADPCPGATSYMWINDAGLTVATTEGIPNDENLVGTATRYAYGPDGCLLCKQIFHLVHTEELTQLDVDNMTPELYFFSKCSTVCMEITPYQPIYEYTSNVSCNWIPALTVNASGNYVICPPWSQYDNQEFIRYCYNEDECLISARKVKFVGEECDPGAPAPTMGVAESLSEIKIVVRPNPNNGQFTIVVDAPIESEGVSIIDSYGRTLQVNVIKLTENQFSLNLTNHAPGFYYVRIGSSQEKIVVVK